MNQSILHGGPVRGNDGSLPGHQGQSPLRVAMTSQDARSNLAVQPAANSGSFKLKKKAVKIVSAAGPILEAPPRKPPIHPAAMVSSTLPTDSPIPNPLPDLRCIATKQLEAAENERPEVASKLAASSLAPFAATKMSPSLSMANNDSLDDLFARLSVSTSTILPKATKALSCQEPNRSVCSFDDYSKISTLSIHSPGSTDSKDLLPKYISSPLIGSECPEDKRTSRHSAPEPQGFLSCAVMHGESQNQREREYLRKAAVYFGMLPLESDNTVQSLKMVASKLHIAYAPNITRLQPEEAKNLQSCLVISVVDYVNKKAKSNPEPVTVDFVEKVLQDSDGDFLQLCAALVTGRYIELDGLKHITGLCQNVLDMLPKEGHGPIAERPEVSKVEGSMNVTSSATLAIGALKAASDDPLTGAKTWPTQEKRGNGAIFRACILKGVGWVTSLNELQALIWGGRLESISMPKAGSNFAVVKFLTAEACQKYLNSTNNGIEIQHGTRKMVILVDKQPEPSSINDVIQNCIEGDVTRCVRATGANDDWPIELLFKLAHGDQQIPRDVEHIKQGRNAHNHHYIDFRFGNIYHALQFRRHLMEDEEWEHCSIGYSPDPCERVSGVHPKDADGDGGGLYD